jgi:hypothetical protein
MSGPGDYITVEKRNSSKSNPFPSNLKGKRQKIAEDAFWLCMMSFPAEAESVLNLVVVKM